jgi:hypothetical protein
MAADQIDHLDLVDAELRGLAEGVIDTDSAQPFGLYVFRSDDPASELARYLERGVFLEAFGNSPELLTREYGPYEDACTFLCVIDHRRRVPAGMMRLILPSDAGLKSLIDLELVWEEELGEVLLRTGVNFAPERVWDIATLAVGVGYRGRAAAGLVSLALYQSLIMSAFQSEIDYFVTILDAVVLRAVQGQIKRPFSVFPGVNAQSYLGSKSSLPVWCDIRTWSRRLAEVDPTLYELFFKGHGLEAAVAPPDWGWPEVARTPSPLAPSTRSVGANAPAG